VNITREFYTLNLPFVKLGATSKLGAIPSNKVSFLPPLPSGNMVFLKNTHLRVGFNLDAGAGLSFLGAYQQNPNFSYVNAYDAGRMMQQSYYGNEDGSFWAQTPWRYNPVQAGSWQTSLGNWTYLSKVGAAAWRAGYVSTCCLTLSFTGWHAAACMPLVATCRYCLPD
jgi:hypothetical protein